MTATIQGTGWEQSYTHTVLEVVQCHLKVNLVLL